MLYVIYRLLVTLSQIKNMDGKDTHAFGNGVGEILRKLQLYLYYFISLKISEANIAKG